MNRLQPGHRHWWSTAAVVLLSTILWTRAPAAPAADDALRAAVGAGEMRPFAGRIGDLPYAAPGGQPSTAILYAAARILQRRDADDRFLAAALFLHGDSVMAERAAADRAARAPASCERWSDLAAIRYEAALQRSEPRALILALSAADRALAIDPSSAAALFNRALILGSLDFTPPAVRACNRYLAQDSTSRWAAEIRALRQRVASPAAAQRWAVARKELDRAADRNDRTAIDRIVQAYPQECRRTAEGELLADWAELILAGDEAAAARRLTVAAGIGDALRRRTGECLLSDAVATIERSRGMARHRLAGAHATYRCGGRTWGARRILEARPLVERAAEEFAACGSPMALQARYLLASIDVDRNTPEEAASRLLALQASAPRQYRALHASVLWELSTLHAKLGEIYQSLEETMEAGRLFQALGERDSTNRMQINAASTLATLGRDEEAWRVRGGALPAVFRSGNATLIDSTLNGAARDELFAGHDDVARPLFQLQLETTSAPRFRFDALLWRTLIDQRSPWDGTQGSDFGALQTAAFMIEDPSLREEALSDARFAEATSVTERDARRSCSLFTKVIAYWSATRRAGRLPGAYLGRARAFCRIGDTERAIADLRTAVSLLESQRAEIGDDVQRDAFFGTAGAAFEELCDLYARRGQPRLAFEIADRARGRVLLDRIRSSQRQPLLSLSEVQRRLREDTLLIHITTLPTHTLVFTVGRQMFQLATIPHGRQWFRAAASRFAEAVRSDDVGKARTLGTSLTALLEPALRSAPRLVAVTTDETFDGVPFTALPHPDGGFVIERCAIVLTPSASAYLRERHSDTRAHSRALVVGDPALPPDTEPSLPALPDARQEARVVARLYEDDATLLLGGEATKQRLLDELPSVDVFHFAGHILSNDRDPSLSVIPLARAGKIDPIYPADLTRLDLGRVGTVVLAGCGSGAPAGRNGSLRTMASAFLIAGSQAVVATLWNVDDDATRDLSVRLHRALRRGASAAEALREAQLQQLRSTNPRLRRLSGWGAAQVIACH